MPTFTRGTGLGSRTVRVFSLTVGSVIWLTVISRASEMDYDAFQKAIAGDVVAEKKAAVVVSSATTMSAGEHPVPTWMLNGATLHTKGFSITAPSETWTWSWMNVVSTTGITRIWAASSPGNKASCLVSVASTPQSGTLNSVLKEYRSHLEAAGFTFEKWSIAASDHPFEKSKCATFTVRQGAYHLRSRIYAGQKDAQYALRCVGVESQDFTPMSDEFVSSFRYLGGGSLPEIIFIDSDSDKR
jgi:hypothetical protein